MSDLIDRNMAIAHVNAALFPKINTAKEAEKALRELPTIEEWKKGEWSSDMWESPINAIYEAKMNAFEDAVFSAVMNVGIDVNKEELIKALAYDRQQYAKGYADAKAEIVRCKDCEFYYEDEKWCRRLGLCGAFDAGGFCSHGERRTDETD